MNQEYDHKVDGMNVIVPRLSGFCPGVKTAEKRLFELKNQFPNEKIYIFGYLINNRNYIDYLETRNVFTTDDIDTIPMDAIVVIRTHGIDIKMKKRLLQKHRVVDLTCTKVKRVQQDIQTHAAQGYFIIVTGKKDHPEIKGLVSYAEHYIVIEEDEELIAFLQESKRIFEEKNVQRVLVISQTTGDRELFELTISKLKKAWDGEIEIAFTDFICPVTQKKEEEALRLQKQVEISFVVGDKLSSNAKKLYRILAHRGFEVYFIEDRKELESLRLPLSRYRNALVVSSASTPVFVEKEVCDFLSMVTHSEGNLV